MSPSYVSPVLVGRADELGRLLSAATRAAAGQPAVVLVAGEAGVGKSRLVEAAVERSVADGALALVGGCVELGGSGLPFAPLVEVLRALARAATPQELDAILGPARGELSRLLPELVDPSAPAPPPAEGGTSQLLELVAGVVDRAAAQRPLVLVFEDVHWADRSTLDLLAFLVRALRGMRVLLVMTYRSDELDRRHPLRPVLSSWDRTRHVERIELARFDRAAVAAQLQAILGSPADDALVALVHERSEGNAFLVEEVLEAVRSGARDLPPSLRDVLLTRVERLPEPAERVLRVAAVAGRRVPDRLLAAVVARDGGDPQQTYAGLRAAVDGAFLVVDDSGRGYAFRHALLRDAVYEDLLPGERVALHTAYAEVLSEDPGLAEDETGLAATLAYHWYAAYDLPRALRASVEAGRSAAAAYAPAEALRHFERALEVWSRVPDAAELAGMDVVDVLRAAARAAFHRGDLERSAALLDRALAEVDDGDTERVALLLEQRALVRLGGGEIAAGIGELEAAAARLPAEPPTVARAAVLGSLSHALFRCEDPRAAAVTEEALAAARATGQQVREAMAQLTLGPLLAYSGDGEAGAAATGEGLRLALDVGDTEVALRGYVNHSDALAVMDRHADSARTAAEGLALARRTGFTRSFGAYLMGNLADAWMRLGRWDEADAVLLEATRLDLAGLFAATVHEQGAHLAILRGAYDQAEAHAEEARRALGGAQDWQFETSLAAVLAGVRHGTGDLDAARDLATRALARTDLVATRYAWPLAWLAMRVEADLAIRARDRLEERPAQARDEVRAEADRLPIRTSAHRAYRALVDAEEARAAGGASLSTWEDAAARWRDLGEPYPQAYALFRLAEAACVSSRSRAAGAATEALDVARRLGAEPLVAELEALARRARLQPAGASDPAGGDEVARLRLTEREREVLVLVAAGRSNSQIAQALFISPKTASVHISNILAKLGVSGRVEAAAVAHRLGLTQA